MWTETDDLETMLSELQPKLTKTLVAGAKHIEKERSFQCVDSSFGVAG